MGGGPLFFSQYTFMGVDPNNLTDDHGIDYAEQTRNHTLINRAYSIDNPNKYKGYSEKAWGLTAGDSVKGYVAHSPREDRGVIDQGQIIVMIEIFRTGLLWKIFMNIPEVQDGMKKLGFNSPYFTQRLGVRMPEK